MPLSFHPPLLNSASPWATTGEDLRNLYDCQYTGALTIRTSIKEGYPHRDDVHQYCFTDSEHSIVAHSAHLGSGKPASGGAECISSLNTLGYSPIPFGEYLEIVRDILSSDQTATKKPIIFSVTGFLSEIRSCYSQIRRLSVDTRSRLLMEINLSCPNISGRAPLAYSKEELTAHLQALATELKEASQPDQDSLASEHDPSSSILEVGIKVPPYTHRDQFVMLISALRAVEPCPITFITAVNTLGSCLLLFDSQTPALNSETGIGVGGLAGASLHPLALGNVRTIRSMLDEHETLRDIGIIGVGGVFDHAGYERMRSVGADAVGVGTALGSEGLGVFSKISNDVERVDKDIEAFLNREAPANRVRHDNAPVIDCDGLLQSQRTQNQGQKATAVNGENLSTKLTS